MSNEKDRKGICSARKENGLTCAGCEYSEECKEREHLETSLPEDIRPGTKQERIYWLLNSGATAKEIIKSKEFASESVYIVARKHFPEALKKGFGAPKKTHGEDAPAIFTKQIKEEKPEQKPQKAEQKPEKVEQNQEKPEENKAIAAVKDYLEETLKETPKLSKKILELDRNIRAAADIEKTLKALKAAKNLLEDGKVITVYRILDNIITHWEEEET